MRKDQLDQKRKIIGWEMKGVRFIMLLYDECLTYFLYIAWPLHVLASCQLPSNHGTNMDAGFVAMYSRRLDVSFYFGCNTSVIVRFSQED